MRAKSEIPKLPTQSNTRNGIQYRINQEQFLRVFLSNGDVPMDSNLTDQATRPFTLGLRISGILLDELAKHADDTESYFLKIFSPGQRLSRKMPQPEKI